MKKILLSYFVFALTFSSCGNPELERLEAKQKESSCKTDWLAEWVETSGNTTALGVEKGFKNELEKFNKLINDSTITCDSLKNKWYELRDKISKQKNIYKEKQTKYTFILVQKGYKKLRVPLMI